MGSEKRLKPRRVVKKYTCVGRPYWEIQVRGLFGWRNEFPAFEGFPAETFWSEKDAMKEFRRMIDGDSKSGVEEVVATFDGNTIKLIDNDKEKDNGQEE